MSESYTPFEKPLDRITSADLNVLRSVHEGWYVEYKEQVPNASSVAKSVTAFANTYGGFLFYGIKEKAKDENVAGEFIGIDEVILPGELDKIRQAIATYSSPDPHFEVKVLKGPCAEIQLDANKAIICLHIPWSPRAPHVHKTGVIYRRVSDSSEPCPENDRHRLSELFKRSDKIITSLKEWYDDDPPFYDSEKTHPNLRILLTADPWRERSPWLDQNIGSIRECFNPRQEKPTLPFNSIQPSRNGVLARQTQNNGWDNLTLTWALDRDLTSEIIVPIPFLSITTTVGDEGLLDGYIHGAEFLSLFRDQKFENLQVLDLNQLYLIFTGIFETLERISGASNWHLGYWGTFKVLNSQRAAPFIDISTVIKRYKETGIPIVFPLLSALDQAYHPNTFARFDATEDGKQIAPEVNAVVLMIHLARALGLPIWEDPDEDHDFYQHLAAAGTRSLNAQTLRNKRRSA